jgi:hypothetical protein
MFATIAPPASLAPSGIIAGIYVRDRWIVGHRAHSLLSLIGLGSQIAATARPIGQPSQRRAARAPRNDGKSSSLANRSTW